MPHTLERINPEFIHSRLRARFEKLFITCQPHILIVTDMSFTAGDSFSLSQFVETLEVNEIFGHLPKVTKAHTGAGGSADINNFTFDDSTNGLIKSRYDVCFVFAFGSGVNILSTLELDTISEFMEAGGGFFATGDHEDLGAAICSEIPRIRNMRKWIGIDLPDFSNENRLSTNLPGDDNSYIFDDQSDIYPQRLFLNWRSDAGGLSMPHPLMQAPNEESIDYIPDHPHEGECIIPQDLTTQFILNGTEIDEWPIEEGGTSRISPEVVAKSMSHGNGFSAKDPLFPREFIAICAYDGQRAGVGRVVTDATWHHFININIDGSGVSNEGLMPSGIDTTEMVLIRQHWVNLANWLMPKSKRICLFPFLVCQAFTRFPLIEELVVPLKDKRNMELNILIAEQLQHTLTNYLLPFQIEALTQDALEIGTKDITLIHKLKNISSKLYNISPGYLGKAALGVQTLELFDMIQDKTIEKYNNHEEISKILHKAAQKGIRSNSKVLQQWLNDNLKLLEELK